MDTAAIPEHCQASSNRIVDLGLEKVNSLVVVIQKAGSSEELTQEERELCRNASENLAAVFGLVCKAQVMVLCRSCRTLKNIGQMFADANLS